MAKSMLVTFLQDDIKKKLSMVCDEIGFLKSKCKDFVNTNLSTLIEELSTTDNAETICVNINICKKKVLEKKG